MTMANADYTWPATSHDAIWSWPDIFLNPDAPFRPDLMDDFSRRGAAIAVALEGWASCMMGNKLPAEFGRAMVDLSKIAGLRSSAPAAFSAACDRWLHEWDDRQKEGATE